MNKEIERKFLVKNDRFKQKAFEKNYIVQGYLTSNPERAVRVRIYKNKGFLTIKGIGNTSGTTRFEWEKEISVDDAKQLLNICEKGVIEKYRYCILHGSHTFEVDEFFGDNKGLIIAELELLSEKEVFKKPEWLGREVTGEEKYYNAMLMKNPFKDWSL